MLILICLHFHQILCLKFKILNRRAMAKHISVEYFLSLQIIIRRIILLGLKKKVRTQHKTFNALW